MKISKEELKELNEKGKVEIKYIECDKEFWEIIEVKP